MQVILAHAEGRELVRRGDGISWRYYNENRQHDEEIIGQISAAELGEAVALLDPHGCVDFVSRMARITNVARARKGPLLPGDESETTRHHYSIHSLVVPYLRCAAAAIAYYDVTPSHIAIWAGFHMAEQLRRCRR